MTRPLGVAALVLAVLVSAAHAEPVQITIAPPAEATTMDPGRSTQVLTVNYFVNLYDTLTRWDAALRLQPGLATSWRNLNDTTWELTLRPGVKFHDGSPLTAEDVKATLERNLLPGKTVVQAGFAITGTWPVRSERGARSVALGTNALTSSIVVVCRPRPADGPTATRRQFLADLRGALPPAVAALQAVAQVVAACAAGAEATNLYLV